MFMSVTAPCMAHAAVCRHASVSALSMTHPVSTRRVRNSILASVEKRDIMFNFDNMEPR